MTMRIVLALAALTVAFAITMPAAEAREMKKKREMVVKVKPRSFLDAGTNVQPGTYQLYSLGLTPFRVVDSVIPTGSIQQRLLPGRLGIAW